MYYVVPKDRSIVGMLKAFEYLYDAREYAQRLKDETGNNYDVLRVDHVWTTQTFDEAMIMAFDVPNMARD